MDLALEVVARDPAGLEPVAELLARDPRERPASQRPPQAGGLADQQDARHGRVGLGVAGDRDRLALVQEARQVAPPAGAEPGVEGDRGPAGRIGRGMLSMPCPITDVWVPRST